MVDAEGGQTSYQYWPLLEEEKFVIDHYGNLTSKAYDARGRLTVETIGANLTDNPAAPASGYTTRTAYNTLGAPTSMADPEGRLTTFSYYPGTTNPHIQTAGADAQNPSIGDKTTYTYHPGGEIATITDALNHTTAFTLTYHFSDPAYPGAVKRETTTVTDAERGVLRESHTYYDAQENRIAESVTRTLPDGTSEVVITRYAYDSEQRLTATFLPDGRVMETRYNAIGKEAAQLHWRTVSHYESEDESLARVTSMEYDAQGNLTLNTHPDGSTEQTVYDAENRPETPASLRP